MMSIYENCPVLKSEHYLLRLTQTEDLEALLSVYSDRNALPFFNSDNCKGESRDPRHIGKGQRALPRNTYGNGRS